jgi:hypothetical protein
MLGIILFIHALLSYLAQENGRLSLVLGPAHDTSSQAGPDAS